MSPPSTNILLDPIPEIRAALKSNSFGISSSRIIEESSFPVTRQDLESIKDESRSTGTTSVRVVGRAEFQLLGEEGKVGVRLDRSGWTVETIQESSSSQIHQKLNKTYESLESLLIDISELYVREMNNEIWKRFGMDKHEDDQHQENI
ncbi:hypothetical protein I203_102052 [Kwoniella mangroviensis CBS 8507]|uniref:uncharacterized protein n=1 Tax=Kwoniella mangroviensis CBS 8507 TaxID=1296122 RepID=UPI00080D6CD3|nr:uncharacterized protein I203_03247 [Kwoniella mangroviensis CBS 8507]OCF67550.1 hypothetical protein I203_03247 [Kwoniella mangroviensis CBS 8507]